MTHEVSSLFRFLILLEFENLIWMLLIGIVIAVSHDIDTGFKTFIHCFLVMQPILIAVNWKAIRELLKKT